MSHEATIMIAPILDAERWKKPEWERPGRHLYWSSSLELLPSKEPRPLLVNHDPGRRIGTVEKLWRLDWPGGAWIVASCTVPEPPAWLKRDTPASFGRFNVHTTEPGEVPEVVTSAFVSEVSVLLGEEPAEPLAKVLSLRPTEEPKRTATKSPAAVRASDPSGEVIYGDGKVIRRYYGNAVIAVGGRPVRRSSDPSRRSGDYVIEHADGSATIYSPEGYREALRDGTLGVR